MRQSVDHDLLGTVVRLRIGTGRMRSGAGTERRVFAELRRLQGLLSRFEPTSDVSRFRSGAASVGPELVEVLRLAAFWHERTGGRFDPAPGHDSLPWTVQDDRVEIVGDCSSVDVNGVAKGWIVDRAVERSSARSIVIDAGGDIVHRGAGSTLVGVENPLTPQDNAPPLLQVELSNAAITTSGPARRGDHLWGAPEDPLQSVSVIAANAANADALATAFAVGEAAWAVALADQLDVAVALVQTSGQVTTNERWERAQIT